MKVYDDDEAVHKVRLSPKVLQLYVGVLERFAIFQKRLVDFYLGNLLRLIKIKVPL